MSNVSFSTSVICQDLSILQSTHKLRSSYRILTSHGLLVVFIVTSWDRSNKNRPADPPDITPRTCLTCVMNEGQNLSIQHFDLVLITLDPFAPPHPLLVAEVWEFTDLGICTDTLQVLSSLPAIQSKRGLSFCFSWTGHGVLGDAVTSGLTVAVEHLDAKVPFAFEHHPDISDVTELPQLHLSLADHLIRTLLSLFRVYVLVIEISLILLGALRGSLKNRMCLPRSERPFVLVELG